MNGSNLSETKIGSDPTHPTQVMKCYEQFSNFRNPQLPLGTHQSGSKVKDVKKPNAKVKEVQLRERKKSGEKYKIKPWGNQFNLKAKEAIQSIKRIGDCHKNSKRNATKIPETGTRVSAHRCWLDAEALLWLTAAGAVSAIATGGEREGGCRGWKQSPDGWGE